MKENELVMTELLEQSKYENTPLIEVVSNYCQDNDIDPNELIKMFDSNFIYKLKSDAYKNNVRLTNSFKSKRKSFFEEL